ncbi:hypothetical protein EEL30_22000 [Brevibacillus laterosporus]|uniref:Uncharacterized protein n=1 Tax=Brevibacillus laterosporus TaxID=1465 RepID=A0A518VCJ9_BRELA|nr:hypothetical protein EEL30_22000 [Brevibacillus laterosporus]
MDKNTFDVIKKFESLASELYFELENELGVERADKLLKGFDAYQSQLLKLGKYADEEKMLDKQGFLKDNYDGFPRYLKLTVIYEYNNGFSLCETTSGLILLAPTELISTDTE